MKTTQLFLLCVSAVFILGGCASVISKDVRTTLDETVGIQQVLEQPDTFIGTRVLWAGIIIETSNFSDHTMLEVLQHPADFQGRPIDVDTSEGRFFGRKDGFLDPAIYAVGRKVTIAGEVQGNELSLIGEYEYPHPVVKITEIHLWPVEPEEKIYNYYYYPSYPRYYRQQWMYW